MYNPSKIFQEKIKSLKNILIVIKTINGNIFGFFYSDSPNQIQNQNQNISPNNQYEEIFNTNLYTYNSIIFSYTKNKAFIKEDCIYPNFSIHYDIIKKCFLGTEITSIGKYILNGTQQFIIQVIEVYEILYYDD